MANTPDIEVQDSSINTPDDDKTSKNNEDELSNDLSDIPDEDDYSDDAADKGKDDDADDSDEEEAGTDGKPKESAVIQKKKYRDKYLTERVEKRELQKKVADLEEALKQRGDPSKPPENDAERKAQEYIERVARGVLDKALNERQEQERKVVKEFEEKVDDILEENSDFTEDELLGVIEEFKLEPEVAARILRKQKESSAKPKPKPKPVRRTPAPSQEENPNQPRKRKDWWEIANEIRQDLKRKVI